jgi:hypothetical protein
MQSQPQKVPPSNTVQAKKTQAQVQHKKTQAQVQSKKTQAQVQTKKTQIQNNNSVNNKTVKSGGRRSAGIIGSAIAAALVPFGLFAAQKEVQKKLPTTPYKSKTKKYKNKKSRHNKRRSRKYRK